MPRRNPRTGLSLHGAPLLSNASVTSQEIIIPALDESRWTSTRHWLHVSTEAQAHWESNYIFRTLVLGLHFITMLLVTIMFIFPSVYSGCATFMSVFPTIIVCTCMPAGMWLINGICHRTKRSKAKTKLALGSIMCIYYVTIVLADSRIHIMVSACCVAPRGHSLESNTPRTPQRAERCPQCRPARLRSPCAHVAFVHRSSGV